MNGSQKTNSRVYSTERKPEGFFDYGCLVLLIFVVLVMGLTAFWFLDQKKMNIVDPFLKMDQAFQDWKDGQRNVPY